MGIGVFLKSFLPLTFYLSGLTSALMGLSGNVRWALMLVVFLLPLRNVIEKIQILPFGNQFIDILLIGIIVGGMISKKSSNSKVLEKSSISTIAVITVIYLLFSVLWGGFYLYGGFNFDFHDSRTQDWKNFSLMPLLFFLNFKNNVSKKDVWAIFTIMCFSMFVVDYYTMDQIKDHPALMGREKIKGTFQFLGPNEVAAFLNEYTIILMSVLYAIKKGWSKWLLLVLILANVYCVLFLYSRGAYAGLMAGMFILFAFKDKKLLIPLFLVLLLWQSVLPQNVIDRIKETKTATGELDESSQRRIDIWQQAYGYIKSNPIIGIGFGSFRHLGLDLGDTHNIYVKIMTEQGLVGICILLFTIFLFIKEGWRLYQKGDDELSKALGLGFVCCIFVMMVNNFFGDRWSYLEPNAYLWIFAGLVARLNIISQNPQSIPENAPKVFKAGIQKEFTKNKKRVRYYDL
jgi:O-antigen ligase